MTNNKNAREAFKKIPSVDEILKTIDLIVPPVNRRFKPPSNKTRLTNKPTIVSNPLPRSKGSTNPRPDLPINKPDSNNKTTPGSPVSTDNNLAPAPEKTVMPQSKPSRSGVINH